MEMDLQRISQKPHDYKKCLECGKINWYENDVCIGCHYNIFDDNEYKVNLAIADEYTQYEDLGYTEEEIDNIYIEV